MNDNQFNDLLSNHQQNFDAGLFDRIMDQIHAEAEEGTIIRHDFTTGLTAVFKRFAYSGVAAIFIFMISIYVMNGSISGDSLTGTADLNEENLSTFMLYDYN